MCEVYTFALRMDFALCNNLLLHLLKGGQTYIFTSRHGAEYIFMSTSTSTLLVDEYEYKYVAKTRGRVHFHDNKYNV